jgi:hypothetical protein
MAETGNESPRVQRVRHFPLSWLTAVLLAGIGIGLWSYGSPYYRLPPDQRPDSPLHQILDPARFLGHGLGVAGGAMLLATLLYSLRKRVRSLQRCGEPRRWLSAHIFLGLAGPLLVTFHTGFEVGGIVSIAYWSMIVTMLSGIFGRYLYAQLPRYLADERAPALREEATRLEQELAELLGPDRQLLVPAPPAAAGAPGWRVLLGLVRQDCGRPLARWRWRRLLRRRTARGRGPIRRAVRLAQRRMLLERRLAMAEAMERLFHYWHVFHRPFIWILFIVVAIHVGVALFLGYTWL